jgi:hypothetical protein
MLDANSTALRDQVYDFTLIANRKSIPLFCFLEQHESNIAKIVVPKSWTFMKVKVKLVLLLPA